MNDLNIWLCEFRNFSNGQLLKTITILSPTFEKAVKRATKYFISLNLPIEGELSKVALVRVGENHEVIK